MPERWTPGSPADTVTVRVLRKQSPEGHAYHVLERRGGTCPPGWICLIDPETFEPFFAPPEQNTAMGPVHTSRNADMPESDTNWFQREKYTTYAHIRDLRKVQRFVINTPTFRFDSHADNRGWMLVCKQRHFQGKAGKLVIKLVHESNRVRSTVHIRPSNHNLHRVVETEADFIEVFNQDFVLETEVIAQQTHMPLSGHSSERLIGELNRRGIELTTDMSAVPTIDDLSDEDLLTELKRRSEARLNGWRPRRRTVDLANVINLEEIRQNLPVIDEEKLARILAA